MRARLWSPPAGPAIATSTSSGSPGSRRTCWCSTQTVFLGRPWARIVVFDSSPSASQNEPERLASRNAVITGANQGLGLAIAEAYVDAGASVLLCARDKALLDAAGHSLASKKAPEQTVEVMRADVSNPADVARLAQRAFAIFPQVHVLVNNAGVYGPMGPSDDVDWAAWVRAMEINVYGSVLPARAFVPHFKPQRYGKIVQLSGGGATNPLPRISAYAASKAAIVRFAESLALEVQPLRDRRQCHRSRRAEHATARRGRRRRPGGRWRRLSRPHGEDEARGRHPSRTWRRPGRLSRFGSERRNHRSTLERRVGSVGDPPRPTEDLVRGDVYTLRRIVPKDRGFTWGDR